MPPPCVANRDDGAWEPVELADDADGAKFWRKPLREFSEAEWEALCDGCGRCCLVKLEDEDTGELHFTSVGCRLLDRKTGRCGDYAARRTHVPDCVKLEPAKVPELAWLPPTCAYRLVDEGKDLMWWHPLVSGSAETVHEAGVSVRGRVAALENEIAEEAYPDHIVRWPMRTPARAKAIGLRKKTVIGK